MTHNKNLTAPFLNLLFYWIMVFYLLNTAPHSWAKCSQPLQQRLELGGGSQQASALETAQSTLAYMGYYRGILSNSLDHTAQSCHQTFQLSYGLSGAYAYAHENSLVWSVIHRELNLNLVIESAWQIGVGTLGLKNELGGIWLLEDQERLQANRLNSEILSTLDSDTSNQLSLSRDAQQVLPLFRASPFIRLNILEGHWGELGLNTELNLDYRLLNPNTPSLASPWAWGLRLGIYLKFAHLSSRLISHKNSHKNQSNIIKENKL